MIIGSDFDGVIADDTQARISYIKEKYGVIVTPQEVHGTPLEKKVGKEARKDIEKNLNCTEQTLSFAPTPGVAETFRKFIADGDKILIITYRSKEGVSWARAFLDKYKIPYHHILSAKEFTESDKGKQRRILRNLEPSLIEKGKVASALKPAIFVEDSDRHLATLYPLKDEIKLLLFDHPFNKNVNMKDVQRIHSWPEIYELVQDLKTRLAYERSA